MILDLAFECIVDTVYNCSIGMIFHSNVFSFLFYEYLWLCLPLCACCPRLLRLPWCWSKENFVFVTLHICIFAFCLCFDLIYAFDNYWALAFFAPRVRIVRWFGRGCRCCYVCLRRFGFVSLNSTCVMRLCILSSPVVVCIGKYVSIIIGNQTLVNLSRIKLEMARCP